MQLIDEICKRALTDGGFSERPGTGYRPDATAWAALALSESGKQKELLEASRSKLVASQISDGRVCLAHDHPDSFWPTPLAVLAWQGSVNHSDPKDKAIHFLLKTAGQVSKKDPKAPYVHDTAIQGWPWIENTYAWVNPTATALLALHVAGYIRNERLQEAIRFLLDRQLPHGGWNYGNTLVYGQELRPQPETSGIALASLANCVPRGKIKRSLDYLMDCLFRIRTPLSLAWIILGLSAWGERPHNARKLILECFQYQDKYDSYKTTEISLLTLALLCEEGIVAAFNRRKS